CARRTHYYGSSLDYW
nr:immunoglobulin heavy chain junction region [Mus musculus]MBK4197886.1 immunoglobulin heavy chain junction region [Mus musculus]MBK4197887.1 immunoglobulin heavy chain junction region [Mus musculus]MBK4197888.1 immunoglobulin heavy chain junction region [Mus musculus]MBK4197889.1 immunoglobulin heavy chain junction region [Mus musculus]